MEFRYLVVFSLTIFTMGVFQATAQSCPMYNCCIGSFTQNGCANPCIVNCTVKYGSGASGCGSLWSDLCAVHLDNILPFFAALCPECGNCPTSCSQVTPSPAPAPSTTGVQSPSTTGTPAPSTTGSPPPSTTGTPAPSTTGTPAPSTTGTPSPSTTGTPAPSTTGTPSTTGVPATTGTTGVISTTGVNPGDYTTYPPIAGDNVFALGLQSGAYVTLNSFASTPIANAFSLEMWFSINSMGTFQPLFSHYDAGEANHLVDFNLQVLPNGKLSFFMGNGDPHTVYGLQVIGSTIISSQTWYHVAVAVDTDVAGITRARLYLNGDTEGESKWNVGSRQHSNSAVIIGKFDNSDSGYQSLSGNVDEIRVWDTFLYPDQVEWNMDVQLAGDEEGLVVYHKVEEGSGTSLIDYVADHKATISGAASWMYANLALDPVYNIDTSKVDRMVKSITLPAVDLSGRQLVFTITSLPTFGTLFSLDGNGNVNGVITSVPVTLATNEVGYLWDITVVNAVDSFDYHVALSSNHLAGTSASIILDLASVIGCNNVPGAVIDACGVCGGDGSSCQCVWGPGFYKGYDLMDLDKIMAFYTAESTLDLLKHLYGDLVTVNEKLDTCLPLSNAEKVNAGPAIKVLQNFEGSCLKPVKSLATQVSDLFN